MSKHTPGPWKAMDWDDGYVVDSPSETVAQLTARRSERGRADANLIAAAPEMYEALECVLHELRNFDGVSERTERRVESALAKAEGRS